MMRAWIFTAIAVVFVFARGAEARPVTMPTFGYTDVEQERINLAVAETKPSNSQYTVDYVTPSFSLNTLTIGLLGQNGEKVTCVYNSATSPTGLFLNTQFNKADFSSPYAGNATSGSLKQRIFHRFVILGEALQVCDKPIAGTLAGSVP